MKWQPDVPRRKVLISGGLAAAAPLLPIAKGAPSLVRAPGVAGAPPPEQLHVQFGADAATEMAVSWGAADAVARSRLRLGRARHGDSAQHEFRLQVPAEERVSTHAPTGERVFTYHP